MSEELKPCPFCRNEPAPYWKGAGCVTSGCVLNGLHLDADKWNRRAQPAEALIYAPVEPSLEMQNAGWREIAKQGADPEELDVASIYRAMLASCRDTI